MKRRVWILGVVLVMLAVCGAWVKVVSAQASATSTSDDEARGKAWWAHIQVLADDSMRGRQTGSPDYMRAAAYVVKQFKADGLAPAGVGGSYFQPVHFVEQWVSAGKSSVSLVVDGQAQPLALGQDAVLGSYKPQPPTVDAGLVFIGYGLHLPESNYDDFNSAEYRRPH